MGKPLLKIEFNDNEIKVLKELLNIALKSVGMDAAQACLYFSEKLDGPKDNGSSAES